MPELRRDPVNGRWVIISTERGQRPLDYSLTTPQHGSASCPFCPGHEAATPPEVAAIRAPDTVPDGPGWTVRAIPNKFPALTREGRWDRADVGLYERMNGVGAHEVVIESPVHEETLADMSVAQVSSALSVCQGRFENMMSDSRLRYVMLFKNQGEAAGASLAHPHFQLIAMPLVPKRILEELDGVRNYRKYNNSCIYCDIIAQELRSTERVVDETGAFVALTPFAARCPGEIRILPKMHQAVFHTITEPHRRDLADIIIRVLRRLKIALNDPAYNLMFHVAPFGQDSDWDYHWHVEIIPRIIRVGGFEWGTGLYINPTAPEASAEVLRAVSLQESAPVRSGAADHEAAPESAG